jgi:hypothetical protein
MWRVAIYAHEIAGHVGRRRLERQIAGLTAQVARQPGWHHVDHAHEKPTRVAH